MLEYAIENLGLKIHKIEMQNKKKKKKIIIQ